MKLLLPPVHLHYIRREIVTALVLGFKTLNYASDNCIISIGSWVAFDMEWEPGSVAISQEKTTNIEPSHPYNNELPNMQINKITTFAYEDSYGNTKSIDINDFVGCPNPGKEFLLAVKNKLLLYDYCFAWGSKVIKYKNKKTGYLEGIYGDLVVLEAYEQHEG